MALVGAAIIGFLLGLIVCYWKQLRALYDNRDTISDVSDVGKGIEAAQRLWERV